MKVLRGEGLDGVEEVLKRLGRNQKLPHWYKQLKAKGTLPNLDGKTVGSVVEMLFAAVLETEFLEDAGFPPLLLNPASGVDIADLELGVKSPSRNYDTSEPFFSPYERLIGNEYDAAILLTNYQEAKKEPPLKLQIIEGEYLKNTQLADATLCELARKHRDWLIDDSEARAKKFFKFLALAKKGGSDWRAFWLLKLLEDLDEPERMSEILAEAESHFEERNDTLDSRGQALIPQTELDAIKEIQGTTPLHLGVLEAADNWVVDMFQDLARIPNENEWHRIKSGPLDGRISVSYALQWRFTFRLLFN